MSRPSTGATHVKAVPRIELKYLLDRNLLVKGELSEFNLSWLPHYGDIRVIGFYTDEEAYIRLIYTLTTHTDGQTHNYDYKIRIAFVGSNLGKGKVPYFICPSTGEKCRILYRAYGSHKWKSRQAFKKTLYYPTQLSCTRDYSCTRFHRLNDFIADWGKRKYRTDYYNGVETKSYQRLKRLRHERNKHEYLMWQPHNMPVMIRNMMKLE